VLEAELTLRDYMNLFLRRWWLIALCTVGCLAAALFWTARQAPLYESSAVVLINQASASDIFDPLNGASAYSYYAERWAENEARFVSSGVMSETAIERLGYEGYVDVATDDFADILTLSAVSTDPVEAQEVAQTYAETYVDIRQERFAADRVGTAVKLAERLAEVDLQIVDAVDQDLARLQLLRRDLADSLDLLTITVELADDSGAQIIDKAYLPGEPFSPSVNRNVMLGGVLGLMLGSGLALGLEALDRSVRSREMLESLTPGAPNLAVIPAFGKDQDQDRAVSLVTLHEPTSTAAEAFRTLRASLQYVAVDDDIRVLQIASAQSAAGKTTISANLAMTLAQAGLRVAVIDGDLRRPRLHDLFGVPQTPGFTTAIIGAESIQQCLHVVPGNLAAAPVVMPSGAIPPGPSELLGSEAAKSVIDTMRGFVDFVIVDTPPVLAVADTIVLAQHVDASILVVDAKKTTRADVALAYERLQQAGAPVVGTVLNKAAVRRGQHGYGYGYGYVADASPRAGVIGWFNRRPDDGLAVQKLATADIPAAVRNRRSGVSSAVKAPAPKPRAQPVQNEKAQPQAARNQPNDPKPAPSKPRSPMPTSDAVTRPKRTGSTGPAPASANGAAKAQAFNRKKRTGLDSGEPVRPRVNKPSSEPAPQQANNSAEPEPKPEDVHASRRIDREIEARLSQVSQLADDASAQALADPIGTAARRELAQARSVADSEWADDISITAD